jgi:tripartite-type tricarboxylate transporter receptor subunit TctC
MVSQHAACSRTGRGLQNAQRPLDNSQPAACKGEAQLGIPDAEAALSQMLLAPAGTPRDVVARLEHEILATLRRADVHERMQQAGLAVIPLGGKQLGEKMAAELALWKDLVARAGIKPN